MERNGFRSKEFRFCGNLRLSQFHVGRNNGVAAFESKPLHELFALARGGFVLNSLVGPSNNYVEYRCFLAFILARAQTSPFSEFAARFEVGLEPTQGLFKPSRCEVVPVDAAHQILLRVNE